MKNILNFCTESCNHSHKQNYSLKNATPLKFGQTENSFRASFKQNKTHGRIKTDQYQPQHPPSTISILKDNKVKVTDRQKQNKKIELEYDLKKTGSSKILTNSSNMKLYSVCKTNYNEKDLRHDSNIAKSLNKLRKNINYTNPQILAHQLKSIIKNEKKNGKNGRTTNQWYLLSNQLIETMKIMKKKHNAIINSQRKNKQKREEKLIKIIMETQMKNQRCTTLINELRIRNIDVDGIWYQQQLSNKLKDIGQESTI